MEEPVAEDSALLKPKQKREQSEKQKAVWAKAQQTRLANAQLKKDALAKAKEDIENKKKKKPVAVPEVEEPDEPEVLAKPKAKPKVVYESDSEPEVVVVKRKKKKQQIVYEEESSEDEAPPPPRRQKSVAPVAIPPKPVPIIRFF